MQESTWRTRKRRVQQWKILDWPLHLDRFSGHPSLWSPYFCWPLCTSVILWDSKYHWMPLRYESLWSISIRQDYKLSHAYAKFNINILNMLDQSRGAIIYVLPCRMTYLATNARGASVCVRDLHSRQVRMKRCTVLGILNLLAIRERTMLDREILTRLRTLFSTNVYRRRKFSEERSIFALVGLKCRRAARQAHLYYSLRQYCY